jgi:hypothetical protein
MSPKSKSKRKTASAKNAIDPESSSPKKRSRPSKDDGSSEWNQMFFELMLYRTKHGDISVNEDDDEHESLHNWILQQRTEYGRYGNKVEGCILTEDRIKVLESVAFLFNTRTDKFWRSQFENLKQYKEKHGHLLVPKNCEFQGLGRWVVTQRTQYGLMTKEGNKSQLTPYRKQLLDEIGFVWQVRNRPGWQLRYDELVEYHSSHGHTVSYYSRRPVAKMLLRPQCYATMLNQIVWPDTESTAKLSRK